LSKADELFENMGYEKDKSYNLISYEKDIGQYLYTIVFDTTNKTFYKGSTCQDEAITMLELQAINLKCRELRLDRRRK